MYVRRIRLAHYGPIESLDITLPFDGDKPKPVIFVGENGTGKSIVLSHVVNGLLWAKGVSYPETREVETGKVYKLRSSQYIKTGSQHYYARVDYESDLFLTELRTLNLKQDGETIPAVIINEHHEGIWNNIQVGTNESLDTNLTDAKNIDIKSLFEKNCVLFLPHNRFEEPAWLNERNLTAKAEYMELERVSGYTSRKVLNYSALRHNQNWLFDVVFDRAAFEIQTANVNMPIEQSDRQASIPVLLGYSGQATSAYEVALNVFRSVLRKGAGVRFGIGDRRSREVSIVENGTALVHNIFQLSSGETALLNLFLSILRDFDQCGAPFNGPQDVRGVVVVDEIDLHLHTIHQFEILPALIQMFPNVQFIVTSQSPLFVFGMNRLFGPEGLGLYRMPEGDRIDPEEFSEFGEAYEVFAETSKFADDVRSAIKASQTPIVYVDGVTDVKYLQRAAQLLDKVSIIQGVDLKAADGEGNLGKIWTNGLRLASSLVPQKVILLHDCDSKVPNTEDGKFARRVVPKQNANPVEKGVENLFSKGTLEKAKAANTAFVNRTPAHPSEQDGQDVMLPERWWVNKPQKSHLCDWLCENGDADDFANFAIIFDMLEELLETPPTLTDHS